MKRALVALAMLAALLVPAQAFAAQPDYSIDQLSTDLYVETNASIHVVERQTLTFDGENKGLVWYLHEPDKGESVKISSVRVTPLDEGGVATGEHTTLQLVDSDPETQGAKPGDAPDAALRGPDVRPWYSYNIADGMVRCFFPANAGTYVIETDYTVMNRVHVFRDVAELYWRYADSDMPGDAHDVSLHIALPMPAGSVIEPNSTVRAWGHGPADGTLAIGEDGSVVFHADTVLAGHYAEAHILFPAYWIDNISSGSAHYRTEARRLSAIAEETDWLDQSARASIWDNNVRVLFAPLIAIAGLAAIIVGVAFGRSRRSRLWFVRIAATLGVIALAEQAFFREPLTTAMLMAAAAVIALLAGLLPVNDGEQPVGELDEESNLQSAG